MLRRSSPPPKGHALGLWPAAGLDSGCGPAS